MQMLTEMQIYFHEGKKKDRKGNDWNLDIINRYLFISFASGHFLAWILKLLEILSLLSWENERISRGKNKYTENGDLHLPWVFWVSFQVEFKPYLDNHLLILK